MMNAQDQVRDGVVESGSLEVPITSTNAINEERLQANLKKQEEGFVDVIAGTTKKDMTTTAVAAEKAKKERKVIRTESSKSQTFMVNGQLVS